MQSSNFKGVVYLSQSDYDDLIDNGSITKSGQTLTYDSATLYATPDNSIAEYSAGSTQWDTAPTQDSTKPVTSGGIYTAISNSLGDIDTILTTLNSGNGV